ncbi:low molecular weight protein-tyrosine-phosphatase [Acinetobacter sp. ANC 5502]
MSSQQPYKVLCVCLGNICRSPTAEAVLRHFCQQHQLNVHVDSAGTAAYHIGEAPDSRSQQYARQRGYDLSVLRARQLSLNDFLDFDLILAMDEQNLKNIQKIEYQAQQQFVQLRAEVYMMTEHAVELQRQAIADPYYGGAEGFERVLDQCETASQAWVNVFKSSQKQ